MTDEKFPELPLNTLDFIDLLDKITPHRCIRPGETWEEAIRYAGQRDLVDELLQWKQEAMEAAEENEEEGGEAYRVLKGPNARSF